MTPQEELANYLAVGMKDYQAGVKIFKNIGINSAENNFFTIQSPSKVHVNMLRNKLLNYARVQGIHPQLYVPKAAKPSGIKIEVGQQTAPPSGSGKPMIDMNPVVRFEELPALLQEKFKQAGELQNQNKTLHAELKQLIEDPTKKERRAELSEQMIDNKKTIRACWDSIDLWWAENKEKTKEQRIVDQAGKNAIDKQKRIKANKTYIRRNYGTGKKPEELEARMIELKNWGIDYTEDIEKSDYHTA